MATYSGLFTGIPFVAGSIFGERCWKVSTKGVLISPTYSYGWDFENVSECRTMKHPPSITYDSVVNFIENRILRGKKVISIDRDMGVAGNTIPNDLIVHWKDTNLKKVILGDSTSLHSMSAAGKIENIETIETSEVGTMGINWYSLYRAMRPNIELDISQNHDFSSCACGFYAYTNGVNDYVSKNRVLGVVEGYGETLIGTRGFRSSKARVVAFTNSPEPEPVSASTAIVGRLSVIVSGSPAQAGYVQSSGGNDYSIARQVEVASLAPFPAPLAIPASAWINAGPHVVVDRPVEWDKVLAKYPKAVYFETVEEMRAQFPTTDTSEWIDNEG